MARTNCGRNDLIRTYDSDLGHQGDPALGGGGVRGVIRGHLSPLNFGGKPKFYFLLKYI